MNVLKMSFHRVAGVFLILACCVALPCGAQTSAEPRNRPQLPQQQDLLLWLDAADGVAAGQDGASVSWTDKVSGTALTLEATRVEQAMNGLPVVRMAGGQGLVFQPNLDNGPSTVFVVFQRNSEQTTTENWQRVFSVWDGEQKRDIKAPSYAQYIKKGAEVVEPTISYKLVKDGARRMFGFGASAVDPGIEHLHGDIAEIIVYRDAFDSFDLAEQVLAYLGEKWGIAYNGIEWTREGSITPVFRSNDDYPLSDQQNVKGWTRFEPWCDEFDDGVLDTDKWLPYNHVWYGRAPARFLPENVAEGDGMVTLAIKQHPGLPVEHFHQNPEEYQEYSSATLSSLTAKRYGYIEARAKAEVGSSAFWLYAQTTRAGAYYNQLEIDVYELGGVQEGYETLYNMNAHKFVLDDAKLHTEMKGVWYSDIRFADDFHVFGLEWTEKTLKYYVDGVLVRRAPNVYWHSPLLLLFDTETMPHWFGVPAYKDLPGLHKIDYVRTWYHDDTVDDWQDEYTLLHDPATSRPVEAYIKQFPGHVDKGLTP